MAKAKVSLYQLAKGELQDSPTTFIILQTWVELALEGQSSNCSIIS